MSAPAATLTVTAVVCAYTERRLDDTLAALDSLLDQDRRPDAVLLVVDHHPALARRLRERAPAAVSVVENDRTRGLSGARNTALGIVRAATTAAGRDPRTEIVAFLDDDAAARPDWLARLLAPYGDGDGGTGGAGVLAVGGAARPAWPDAAPAVLPPELWWVVGCSYPGQADGARPDGGRAGAGAPVRVRNLMGCAMTFRLSGLLAAGDFAEDMGRVGTVPLGGEETELCLALAAARPDGAILLDPGAVVDHRVSPDRLGWSYLVRRCVAEGRSKAAITRRWGSGDGLAAERAYTRRILPAALRREFTAAVRAAVSGDAPAARDRLTAAVAVPVALAAAGWGYVGGGLPRGALAGGRAAR